VPQQELVGVQKSPEQGSRHVYRMQLYDFSAGNSRLSSLEYQQQQTHTLIDIDTRKMGFYTPTFAQYKNRLEGFQRVAEQGRTFQDETSGHFHERARNRRRTKVRRGELKDKRPGRRVRAIHVP